MFKCLSGLFFLVIFKPFYIKREYCVSRDLPSVYFDFSCKNKKFLLVASLSHHII